MVRNLDPVSDRFSVPVRPRVQHAPVSPPSGTPARHEPSGRTGAERHLSGDGETGFYLRRSWVLVERMRAAVAARQRGDATGL